MTAGRGLLIGIVLSTAEFGAEVEIVAEVVATPLGAEGQTVAAEEASVDTIVAAGGPVDRIAVGEALAEVVASMDTLMVFRNAAAVAAGYIAVECQRAVDASTSVAKGVCLTDLVVEVAAAVGVVGGMVDIAVVKAVRISDRNMSMIAAVEASAVAVEASAVAVEASAVVVEASAVVVEASVVAVEVSAVAVEVSVVAVKVSVVAVEASVVVGEASAAAVEVSAAAVEVSAVAVEVSVVAVEVSVVAVEAVHKTQLGHCWSRSFRRRWHDSLLVEVRKHSTDTYSTDDKMQLGTICHSPRRLDYVDCTCRSAGLQAFDHNI